MPAIRQLLIAGLLTLTVASCGETNPKLEQLSKWTVADWLHDIDATKAIVAAEKAGELGSPSKTLDEKMKLGPIKAFDTLLVEVSSCYKTEETKDGLMPTKEEYFKSLSTASTDHECLDKYGYKRSH